MSNSVRLTWPDRASHPNSRGHWSKRAKANKAMRKAAYYLTLGAKIKAPENGDIRVVLRSEEHTSELQSLMRISYAVFCLQTKNEKKTQTTHTEYAHSTEGIRKA